MNFIASIKYLLLIAFWPYAPPLFLAKTFSLCPYVPVLLLTQEPSSLSLLFQQWRQISAVNLSSQVSHLTTLGKVLSGTPYTFSSSLMCLITRPTRYIQLHTQTWLYRGHYQLAQHVRIFVLLNATFMFVITLFSFPLILLIYYCGVISLSHHSVFFRFMGYLYSHPIRLFVFIFDHFCDIFLTLQSICWVSL